MSTDLLKLPQEILPPKPQRDERGRLLPGCKPINPTGRPHSQEINEMLRARVGSGQAEIIANNLLALCKPPTKDAVRLAAISEVIDRLEGKPVQQHRIEQTLDPEVIRQISELAAKLPLLP